MKIDHPIARWSVSLLVCGFLALAFSVGLGRVRIDSDIEAVMPDGDDIVSDARHILGSQRLLDRVFIQLTISGLEDDAGVDELVSLALLLETRLNESGLFESVGVEGAEEAMSSVLGSVVDNLPVLFTEKELVEMVAPLLSRERIHEAVMENRRKLMDIEGVGQSEFVAKDPLDLKVIALGRMAPLNPSEDAMIYRRNIVSRDGKRLLLFAQPKKPGSDTEFGRKLQSELEKISLEIQNLKEPDSSDRDFQVHMTWAGTFRAALDNETIIRRDTMQAVTLAAIGIVLLLLLCFPRPRYSLLAVVPAVAGAMAALFVYSLFFRTISAIALGFGGALISMTVDHGIAYLLFLDSPGNTSGREASKKVWAVGLLAALTTSFAFLSLLFGGFPLLAQIGVFAAAGIFFSFLFVHTVFPLWLHRVPGRNRKPILPIDRILSRIGTVKGWKLFAGATVVFVCLAFFARPGFEADVEKMNTVSQETLRAENEIRESWGDPAGGAYLFIEGENISEFRLKADRAARFIDEGVSKGVLKEGFSPAMIFPGEERSKENFKSWKEFWTTERTQTLRKNLSEAAEKAGFTEDGFSPFLAMVEADSADPPDFPSEVYELMGVSRGKRGNKWVMLAPLTPSALYDAPTISRKAHRLGLRFFDGPHFAKHLSEILASTFLRMLIIVGAGVLVLLLILLWDWKLMVAAVLPLVFALVCTLGTLKLLGRPLDIPGLMLAVVVLGMGVDYGVFFVRGHQRFLSSAHSSMVPIRMAVFLAAGSTLVGLTSLVGSSHAVLRSAGVTTSLGIFYSLAGAYCLLPPILEKLFTSFQPEQNPVSAGTRIHHRLVNKRYRRLEPFPRLFSRFKLRLDPMFPRLAQLVGSAKRIIDIGCGYGVPATWLAASRPEVRVLALEPDSDKARIAARALGGQGEVLIGSAPDIPFSKHFAGHPADAVLMLDMVHYLDDESMTAAFKNARNCLHENGRLILRATVPGRAGFAWERWIERFRFITRSIRPVFRSKEAIVLSLEKAGFDLLLCEPVRSGREEHWFTAKPMIREKKGETRE